MPADFGSFYVNDGLDLSIGIAIKFVEWKKMGKNAISIFRARQTLDWTIAGN